MRDKHEYEKYEKLKQTVHGLKLFFLQFKEVVMGEK
jgi:hypothetical protein